MKLSPSKRRWTVAAVMVLLLFLFRPGVSRLKSRIIASISSGVGRSVDVRSVRLRLLPRPGFDLQNLVVYDDPAFGAEPMLRASEVTASLRLTSLLRGRLEIARLDLTEPSLNLVHSENGRWNLETLLERAAHTPLAPTAKAKLEPRPGFPYIEATSARINFKNGPEKKPFALTNADFSLWQDSENAWGVRLQAQPVRTDLNLNDTGVLRVSGNWQRAAVLSDTPLSFTLEWSHAQLGQLTKFFRGSDQGWRGGIQLDATLVGTPAKLVISSDASIDDFRRYDITSGQPLRLAAHCRGQYSSLDHSFHGIACTAPVGTGVVTLKGDSGLPGSHDHSLELTAENVPAAAMVALAERAKKNLPPDLTADGVVRGNVSYHQSPGSKLRLEGKGEVSQLRLASAVNKAEIGPETVPFELTGEDDLASKAMRQVLRKSATGAQVPSGPHFEFGPLPIGGRRSVTATAQGWANRGGYSFLVTGEMEIARTLRLARMFGIPASAAAADGTAQVDLKVAGSWADWSRGTASDFPGPQVTGTAKLHNLRFVIRGTGEPVEILSAEMQLAPDQVRIAKLNAKAAGTAWSGSVEMPRGCGTPGACELHFNLNANQIVLAELAEWVSPRPKPRPWYRVLGSPAPGPSLLASLRASGRVVSPSLQIGPVKATAISGAVVLDHGMLAVSQLNADVLGGTHRGMWHADFSVKPALCNGSGALDRVSLARLAEGMKDAWVAGTGSATYEVSGPCSTDFWRSADGTLQFDVRDGTLPHISLAEDEEPLKIVRLSGMAELHAGEFEIKSASLDSSSGKFELTGTASLKRELHLKLARGINASATGFSINGTLAAPQVAPLPGTEQARLKP